MALSMEEQRMLDEMERNLAADDPRLASRFNGFGRPRQAGIFSSRRVRMITGLLALALITVVTLMMLALSPYRLHPAKPTTTPSSTASAAGQARAAPSGG